MRTILIVACLVAAPAFAAECPVEMSRADEAIRAAAGCQAALETFRACAYGSSGDVQLASIVRERCEADFLARLPAKQRRTYDGAQARCARQYARESGSMYRSFEAFCSAELAARHSAKSGRGP